MRKERDQCILAVTLSFILNMLLHLQESWRAIKGSLDVVSSNASVNTGSSSVPVTLFQVQKFQEKAIAHNLITLDVHCTHTMAAAGPDSVGRCTEEVILNPWNRRVHGDNNIPNMTCRERRCRQIFNKYEIKSSKALKNDTGFECYVFYTGIWHNPASFATFRSYRRWNQLVGSKKIMTNTLAAIGSLTISVQVKSYH